MRQILIIIAISVILGLSVAVGSHIMALRPEPSIQSPQQTESHEISLTEELLTKIEERLENIQEDLAELKSRSEESRSLTENSF